ncbi:hypothetical protein SEA_GHOBES_57 [Gordonia phage Ghobes]|uniref:Uncharacterized protein n=1 Tax=Gordonia phage Ghobes TaxID=1887647 RepID=A0A1B3B099_9CAUD|nr:hypothetical protein KCH37_gp57 [Gordonia phage Ghobes]AOE44408.1 hypothetical protein SEA_GHOBES_57 [Gordonia phage Ghobes]
MSWVEVYWVALLAVLSWKLVWFATSWVVRAFLDARLEAKEEQLRKLAVADPKAVASRLGLPEEVVKRYVEGEGVKRELRVHDRPHQEESN